MVTRPGGGTSARGTILLTLAAFLGLYLHNFVRLERAGDIDALREYTFIVVLGLPLVVLAGGWFWARSDGVDEDLLPRLLPWMAGCTLLFVGSLSLSAYAVGAAFDPGEPFMLLHLAAGFGVSIGIGMGIMELRAIQQTREHVRSELQAQSAERDRQRLEFLNNFLRHEVLNSANVIAGHATMLLDDVLDEVDDANGAADTDETSTRDETADRLRTIRNRGQGVATFIGSIREILGQSERPTLDPVDVAAVIEEEAARIEAATDATVSVDVPEGTSVLADDLLRTVFSNLLENAADHAGNAPVIEVSHTRDAEGVTIHVVDDGPGIDADAMETLFEPNPDGAHGNGLFLVRNLVESYGGRIRVGNDGGAHFAVRLLVPRSASTDPVSAGAHAGGALSERSPSVRAHPPGDDGAPAGDGSDLEGDEEWVTAT
jgi:signal transduction histidine kinase